MTTITITEIEAQAIALINEARAAAGLPIIVTLPLGRRGDSAGNPAARALSILAYKVWPDRLHAIPVHAKLLRRTWGARVPGYEGSGLPMNGPEPPYSVNCPKELRALVEAFEAGQLPHLEEK